MWFISFLVTLSMFILLGAWKVIYSWIFTIPPLLSPHFTTPRPPLELMIASFIPLPVSHYPSLLPNLSVGLDLLNTLEHIRGHVLLVYHSSWRHTFWIPLLFFIFPSLLAFQAWCTGFLSLWYWTPCFLDTNFFPLLSWLTLLFDGTVAFSPVASEKELVR